MALAVCHVAHILDHHHVDWVLSFYKMLSLFTTPSTCKGAKSCWQAAQLELAWKICFRQQDTMQCLLQHHIMSSWEEDGRDMSPKTTAQHSELGTT